MTTKPEAVRELQQYLRFIERYQGEKSPLVPTGQMDEDTRRAVRQFQERYQLPVTGEIDLETWERVLQEYHRILAAIQDPVPLALFPAPDFLLHKGASGELTKMVQLVLRALTQTFCDLPSLSATGVFDEDTEKVVQAIQERIGVSPTGRIDMETWNGIAHLYNFVTLSRFACPGWGIPSN